MGLHCCIGGFLMDIKELIDDEHEAIRGYEEALKTEKNREIAKVYRNIIVDEKRHVQMLEKIKSGELEAMSLFGLGGNQNE